MVAIAVEQQLGGYGHVLFVWRRKDVWPLKDADGLQVVEMWKEPIEEELEEKEKMDQVKDDEEET